VFPVLPAYARAGAVIAQSAKALTTALVVAGAVLVQPVGVVTVREYVPAIARVALDDTIGFWRLEVKPLGPVQE